MPRKIEISHKTIVFTIIVLIGLWFLYFIRDILLLFFVSILIAIVLDPFVTKLAMFRVPRAISILVTYIIFITLISVTVAGLVPPLVEQTTTLANNIPWFLDQVGESSIYGEQVLSQILSLVGTLPASIAKAGISIISNVLTIISVLIFAFYLLLSKQDIYNNFDKILGGKNSDEFKKVLSTVEKRLGGWVLGQAALMLLIGLVTYIGFKILSIPFALPLSILAGLLEIVPYIGPIIAAVPAIIIGMSISPVMGVAAAALAFLIQQIEAYVIVPKVMEKTAGVSPIVTLLALSIGFKIAGIIGVIVSVPTVITLQIMIGEYIHTQKGNK